jgi:hypothetical protein
LTLGLIYVRNIPVSGISGGQAPGASNPTNAGTVQNENRVFANFSNKFSDDFNMSLGIMLPFFVITLLTWVLRL